ncbi:MULTISPECIES: hypothetical protein [unclassified Rhizobium]|uniref:hypothetical protein n=1 Tax=unclassified Rhizobium TaxID=2613769 RepID=UPI001ADAFA37|nr:MULTISPECIES: hypothetical protein [unclassified Rhizobium]MBO9100495.1 hypothetical protein [Rhizobium sp. L58/93]MBO9136143.1 hypothetical protein [Rhizobium sp. B209b/85]MBO9171454.1 hypothetical protein [Rhizobium sp. L245/93]MBO9187321.1 hypothetical protein [Rhizobium sp. E27B/91]QXZ87994.1 hypothetical protein J5287_28910 [Rhizobium sp. K1/93]
MTIDHDSSERPGKGGAHVPPHERRRHWIVFPAIAIALAVGAAGGAGAMRMVRPTAEMAPMTPISIATMPASSLVTIKGTVTEIYGNKFILQDTSGKALVETGPAGDGGDLVKQNEAVTVQGRFDQGFVRASFLVDKDGKTEALRAPGPPPHGPFGDLIHRPGP